ncbi:MAG: phage minor head protein [Marivibrio sp.]|uniref:phage minor head protein n=1 Tax=Marivibrio sp. TaxID=2039719 RepID=UPI0032ECD499
MATDKERDRAFRAERQAQRRLYAATRRDTLKQIQAILKAGRERIAAELAATPTDFQAWQLPKIQAAINREMADIGRELGRAAASGADTASQLGVALVDEPLKAGGIRIAAVVTDIDARQLSAIRTFLVDKLADVAAETAAKIKTEIGVAMIGAETPSTVVGRVANMVEGGRGRALTIVRTEMGRAFSVANQERLAQAREVLPGLKKQWRRSGKLYSRPGHDLADGQIVDVDKPFTVNGVKLMFPRDPAGPAAETINCGCESLPIMESWDVTTPGRQPMSDEERQASRFKRELSDAVD